MRLRAEDARPRASDCGVRLGDEIVIGNRVFIVRGVDPMSLDARRVYLEDAETGEVVVRLRASLPAFAEDEAESQDEGRGL